jgi:hypothetical protein
VRGGLWSPCVREGERRGGIERRVKWRVGVWSCFDDVCRRRTHMLTHTHTHLPFELSVWEGMGRAGCKQALHGWYCGVQSRCPLLSHTPETRRGVGAETDRPCVA